jgi:hypothetical protein
MASVSELEKEDAQTLSDFLNKLAVEKDFCPEFEREIATLKRGLTVTLPPPKTFHRKMIEVKFEVLVPAVEGEDFYDAQSKFTQEVDKLYGKFNAKTWDTIKDLLGEGDPRAKITNYGMTEGRRRVR